MPARRARPIRAGAGEDPQGVGRRARRRRERHLAARQRLDPRRGRRDAGRARDPRRRGRAAGSEDRPGFGARRGQGRPARDRPARGHARRPDRHRGGGFPLGADLGPVRPAHRRQRQRARRRPGRGARRVHAGSAAGGPRVARRRCHGDVRAQGPARPRRRPAPRVAAGRIRPGRPERPIRPEHAAPEGRAPGRRGRPRSGGGKRRGGVRPGSPAFHGSHPARRGAGRGAAQADASARLGRPAHGWQGADEGDAAPTSVDRRSLARPVGLLRPRPGLRRAPQGWPRAHARDAQGPPRQRGGDRPSKGDLARRADRVGFFGPERGGRAVHRFRPRARPPCPDRWAVPRRSARAPGRAALARAGGAGRARPWPVRRRAGYAQRGDARVPFHGPLARRPLRPGRFHRHGALAGPAARAQGSLHLRRAREAGLPP